MCIISLCYSSVCRLNELKSNSPHLPDTINGFHYPIISSFIVFTVTTGVPSLSLESVSGCLTNAILNRFFWLVEPRSRFHSTFKMKAHITSVWQAVNFCIRNIAFMHQYLSTEAVPQVSHAVLTSRLDYCTAVLGGLSEKSLLCLGRVQNDAARLVTLTCKYDSITPVLKSAHWLPASSHIQFKILLLTYKILHQGAPCYLQ